MESQDSPSLSQTGFSADLSFGSQFTSSSQNSDVWHGDSFTSSQSSQNAPPDTPIFSQPGFCSSSQPGPHAPGSNIASSQDTLFEVPASPQHAEFEDSHDSSVWSRPVSPHTVESERENLRTEHDNRTGNLRVQCPVCEHWVSMGCKLLNPQSLANHMNGKKCKTSKPDTNEVAQAVTLRQVLLPSSASPTFRLHPAATLGSDCRHTSASPSAPNVLQAVDTLMPKETLPDSSVALIAGPSLVHRPPSQPPSTREDLDRSTMIDVSVATDACPGIPLAWPLDRPFSSYPWQRHEDPLELGYEFAAVDRGRDFYIRSLKCFRHAADDGSACFECRAASKKITRLADLAHLAPRFTPYHFLTRQQVDGVLSERNTSLNTLKLEILNYGRKCARTIRKQDDFNRFLMAVASNDVPRLQQLVRQGLKERVGILKIINRIEASLDDVYHARGYSSKDYDISMLVFRLGGRKLLYALNHHISIPSIRSLRRHMQFTRLMPSLGQPTRDEILFNMAEIFDSKLKDWDTPSPRRVKYSSGMSVFWDEVSQEEVSCYFPHADAVGGLCCEHSHRIDRRLTTFESAEAIATALEDGTVHYGKETSVIAVGSFGMRLRGAFPVVVSPTCKSETPQKSADLLCRVLDCWHNHHAHEVGPIWSFASDGDAGRQAMVYQLFMKNNVDEDHYLYKYLGHMPGLNLCVGNNDITADFDWKHLLKRFGRLLRTLQGIIVGETVINHEILAAHLRNHPELSELDVQRLLNPADAQDVPRAVQFLQAIHSIASLSRVECLPTQLHERHIIGVVGQTFTAFMDPFIQPSWSLTQQVSSLSKYAHLAFALFHAYGISFMPHQLYGDMQTSVKNIVFSIAKQQELDGTQPFYLFWTGDDRLENLFGRVRMQGAHNPNFTFKQLAERLAAAIDLDAVFTGHPDLDSGHRRLKVTRTEHVDHLNPESWEGCARADSVNLQSAWAMGRAAAGVILADINMNIDFASLFDQGRTLDLLRPFGDGKYPGVSTEFDRSCDPVEAPTVDNGLTSSNPHVHASADADGVTDPEGPFVASITTSPDAAVTCAVDDEEIQTILTQATPDSNEEGIDIEDCLEELQQAGHNLPSPPDVQSSDPWLNVSGKKIHKASICRLVITPEWARKSHERTFRVRGYTADIKPRNLNGDNIVNTNTFMVSDLFATMIVCNGTVALAILKCIEIEQKNVHMQHIDGRSLASPATSTKLTGQVMKMQLVQREETRLGTHDRPTESNNSDDWADWDSCSFWFWNGAFIKSETATTSSTSTMTGKMARKMLTVKVAAHLYQPINPRALPLRDELLVKDVQNIKEYGVTWAMATDDVTILVAQLWEKVQQHDGLGLLPVFSENSAFPYCNNEGELSLVSDDATNMYEQEHGKGTQRFRCYQCMAEMNLNRARDHVGQHILRSLRQVPENLEEPVGSTMPCGFCRRSGITACSEVFLTKGSKPQAFSRCRHYHKFHYRPALRSTVTSPSTNVPMLCTIADCPGRRTAHNNMLTAIWKYNMPEHIRTHHPEYAMNEFSHTGLLLPGELAQAMLITDEEECFIGIPKDKIPHKSGSLADNTIPIANNGSKGSKRGRVAVTSGASTSRGTKKRRTE